MNEMIPGSVAILTAATNPHSIYDVDTRYRQDSDFYFLTGFEEPDSVCVLMPDHTRHKFVMFVLPRDREQEAWTGARTGIENAMDIYGADQAYSIHQIQEILPKLIQKATAVYALPNRYPDVDRLIKPILTGIKRSSKRRPEILDPSLILAEMRMIKKPQEIALIQQAIDVTVKGHIAAMKAAAPGHYEYEIQGILEYVFRSHGLRPAFPSVVGSGPNTCILHYSGKDRRMQNGDLLLVDAGAECSYFCADICRTYPVSGKFTPEQRSIYELVLEAQKKGIDAVRIGASLASIHEVVVTVLTEGLIHLGLLKGHLQENIEKGTYRKYFMHNAGHWLGLDVHDTENWKRSNRNRPLEEGMMISIEPGIYIPEDNPRVEFRNIGVRIEDDIFLAPEGPRILSIACPKEIRDLGLLQCQIEDLVHNGSRPGIRQILPDSQVLPPQPNRFMVKVNGRIRFVPVERIKWIESHGRFVTLHAEKEKYTFRESLRSIQGLLDGGTFLQINRNVIANILCISELHPQFNGEYAAVLADGTKLTISRRYFPRIRQQLALFSTPAEIQT